MLERLEQQLGDELAPVRSFDVIYTKQSKIAGQIVTSELQGHTPKGPIRLRVGDLRSLALADTDQIDISKAIPDPGNLLNYHNETKKTLLFKVTGRTTGGFVWGTDAYTTDSTLAMAAVHAGILKAGQTGYVRVRMVPPPASFTGSARHGVTSSPWGAYPAAFRVSK